MAYGRTLACNELIDQHNPSVATSCPPSSSRQLLVAMTNRRTSTSRSHGSKRRRYDLGHSVRACYHLRTRKNLLRCEVMIGSLLAWCPSISLSRLPRTRLTLDRHHTAQVSLVATGVVGCAPTGDGREDDDMWTMDDGPWDGRFCIVCAVVLVLG